MSGAAANAAARRRRLAPASVPTQSQVRSQNTTTCNPGSDEFNNRAQVSKPLTQLDLLKSHEMRLGRLEENNKVGNVNSDSNLSNNQNGVTEDLINKLSERLDKLELALNKAGDYKSDLLELKEQIFRIQNFAMETNLSFMKLQNLDRNDTRNKANILYDEDEDVNNDSDVELNLDLKADVEADLKADVEAEFNAGGDEELESENVTEAEILLEK